MIVVLFILLIIVGASFMC
ncbi:YjcZ family sporulation protein [Bacillus sp. ISL-40]|nr:YjcZ family sporulation protein [Bacillus sp. ISL-40]MBT2722644.1 YjcZ family sporulation protein [Bacillus sp. ISL-46]MBT2743351.1 YjcZ family sporulation protein [Bacillus sp. ISL-77]